MQSNQTGSQQAAVDSRKRKSRELIQNALLELLSEKKPIELITVSEISRRADVSRKTFYNNYHNVQEAKDDLENHYVDLIFSLIENKDISAVSTALDDSFLVLFRTLHDRRTVCRLVFDSGESTFLADRLKKMIVPYFSRSAAEAGISAPVQSYIAEYSVNGLSAMIDVWLHSETMLPVEDIAHLASNLVRSSVASALS